MILVYTSEPLSEDIELVGDAEVTLYAATTATDTDFTARLCVVDEAGRSVNLQEGILRARYRESLADPKFLSPGKVYEFKIDLGPVGARVGAGSRLRLGHRQLGLPAVGPQPQHGSQASYGWPARFEARHADGSAQPFLPHPRKPAGIEKITPGFRSSVSDRGDGRSGDDLAKSLLDKGIESVVPLPHTRHVPSTCAIGKPTSGRSTEGTRLRSGSRRQPGEARSDPRHGEGGGGTLPEGQAPAIFAS